MEMNITSALSEIKWDVAGRLDALLGKIDPGVRRALDRALQGSELNFEEGLLLARTSGLET